MNTRTFLILCALCTVVLCQQYLSAVPGDKSPSPVAVHAQNIDDVNNTRKPTQTTVDVVVPEKKHRRSRKKRQSTQLNTFKHMNYQELTVRKDELVKAGSVPVAIKYLKRMLTLCTDIDALADHLLELGDLLFESEKYVKAVKVYREFTQLYPGDTRVEYALYRAVSASFKCTHEPDRDQTPTHETIELADAFLARGDIFTTHRTEVEKIRTECYQKLVASELNVCSFYLDRGETDVVENRLAIIEKEWADSFTPTKNMVQAFRETRIEGIENIDESPTALLVAKNKPKTNMADRF